MSHEDTKALSKQYQKKSDKQHILDNPDTYVGSIDNSEYENYLYDKSGKILQKNISIIPALYKLFDEGLVNCRDHYIRMKNNKSENSKMVSYIDVGIKDDTITMINDGNGIDVAKHPDYDIWIPEMIFGHLRTSTNYDKTEKKITGGKNGFGFKLVLIWSTWGRIETVDHIRKLKYVQEFEDNLDIIKPPAITKCTGKPYTKISFKPDYKRLGISGITSDIEDLFNRRVYDIAGITDKTIKVKLNGEPLNIKNFQQYVDLYIGNKDSKERIYENSGDRWEYVVCLSDDDFKQVSFVNGINTTKGGKHVEYILNQIIKKITEQIKKKKKIDVKASVIKEQLMIFVRCDIENPSFDSQSKEYLTTPVSKFGSSVTVSDKFIDKVVKLGVINTACAISDAKQSKDSKKTDGSKVKTLRGIPKLVDANYAGTTKGQECTLILCEGDSAKAGIISGLSSTDRNFIGVYPLKGKLLNVRGEKIQKINENNEIKEIKKIMGLESNKEYTKEMISKTLRYGKILFMTDQDLDGSHIKGLGINMFHSEWASLINIDGFINFMNTPIIKARKGKEEIVFYNDKEYDIWKQENNTSGYTIKYYKGLGTSTGKEFQEYFKNRKYITLKHSGESCDNSIDKVFNKKRANDRKDWIQNFDKDVNTLDTKKESISFEEFIDGEMINFSKYDCDRSIPNILDGNKTSQRKVIYCAFLKNLINEIKVAQFSGYVSEKSSYHHGENSLNGTIVGLAQNFVGSNNINLLKPNGQFGTRLMGGKDSASERYIFTQLNELTRKIYIKEDEFILDYLNDDGYKVEPRFYIPIIPMVLVNGALGIGTGFSTNIYNYNVEEIIEWIINKLNNIPYDKEFIPYYEGFKGTISKHSENKFLIKGKYEKINNNSIRITELPIGMWTDDYKQFLENLISNDKKSKDRFIKDYDDMSTDLDVNIVVNLCNNIDSYKNLNELEEMLKLTTTITTTNMHLFNIDNTLVKFNTVEDILNYYYDIRLDYYDKRKKYILEKETLEMKVISNKVKYINEVLDGTIDLRRKKKEEINMILKDKSYDVFAPDSNYNYLIKMTMDAVSEENIAKMEKDMIDKKQLIDTITNTSINKMWENELMILKNDFTKMKSLKRSNDSPVINIKKINKKLKLKVKN